MATEANIKKEIEAIVKKYDPAKYSVWTIGVTDDPVQRKKDHDNPKDWHQWNGSSEEVARNVESHFIKKGMKGGTGGKGNADYVYIF